MKPFNVQLELISELLEGTLSEDGYQNMRFEEANHHTTCYRGIFIKGKDGEIYEVMINQVIDEEPIKFPERKEITI